MTQELYHFLNFSTALNIEAFSNWISSLCHLDPGCIPCFCHAEDKLDKSVSTPTTFFVYKFMPS